MEKIIRGRQFLANGFDVKVALKQGFENGHKSIKIDIVAEHLKTGMKTHYAIPFYSIELAERKFWEEVVRVKNYYSAPVIAAEKVNPMEIGLGCYGIQE